MAKASSWQTKAEKALASGNEREIRQAYADVRHAAQKRIKRMEKAGYSSDAIERLKELKTGSSYTKEAITYQLRYIVKQMQRAGASVKKVKESDKGGKLEDIKAWKKKKKGGLMGDIEHQLKVYVGAILKDQAHYIYIPDFLQSLEPGEIMTNSLHQLYDKLVEYAKQIMTGEE